MNYLSWTKFFIAPLLMVCSVLPSFALTALAADPYGPNETEEDLNPNSNPILNSARYKTQQDEQASGADKGQRVSGLKMAGEVVGACLGTLARYVAIWLVLWLIAGGEEFWNVSETKSGLQNALHDMFNTSSSIEQFIRECLDAVFWALANAILEMMLHSIAVWINSGFEGGPAFITDPEGFFTDMADIIAGEMIFGDDLRVLCSPFQLQLQLNVLLRLFGPPAQERNYCRLSDVVTNVSNFLEGSFEEGGWPAWFTVSITPNQNLWNAMIGVETSIGFRISSRTGTISRETDTGGGFFGIRDKIGKYVAPGKFVQDSANKAFFSGQERLTVADEVDEIVGAIISLILNKVLGDGGLLGLGEANEDDGYGGRVSYLDLLQQDAQGFFPTKQELLSQIDMLLLEAGANPEYASHIPELTSLRAQVVAIKDGDSNSSNILMQIGLKVQQIATDMNMQDYTHYTQEQSTQIRAENEPVIEGPTAPPTGEETELPTTPGTDPDGNPIVSGPTTPTPNAPNTPGENTNTNTNTNPIAPPPPPPPPSF